MGSSGGDSLSAAQDGIEEADACLGGQGSAGLRISMDGDSGGRGLVGRRAKNEAPITASERRPLMRNADSAPAAVADTSGGQRA